MTRPIKRSHALVNLANLVEEHVTHTWPEIARAAPADIWFTGSNVWHFLYPKLTQRNPSLTHDWDIFTIGEPPAQWLVDLYGWNRMPSCQTHAKWGPSPRIINVDHIPGIPAELPGRASLTGYGDGYSYQTDRGIVDLWISESASALAELREYPTLSHAHCRAAWSFMDGLIVLPNERAREIHDSPETRETRPGDADPSSPAGDFKS